MLPCVVHTGSESLLNIPSRSESAASHPRRRRSTASEMTTIPAALPSHTPIFYSPYFLPSTVSRKSCVCHSYETCRGGYQQFRNRYCTLATRHSPLPPPATLFHPWLANRS